MAFIEDSVPAFAKRR